MVQNAANMKTTIVRPRQSPATSTAGGGDASAYLRNLAFLWNFVITLEIFYRAWCIFFSYLDPLKPPFELSNLCL